MYTYVPVCVCVCIHMKGICVCIPFLISSTMVHPKLYLEHSDHILASGPLHILFLPPRLFFPGTISDSFHHFIYISLLITYTLKGIAWSLVSVTPSPKQLNCNPYFFSYHLLRLRLLLIHTNNC